MVRFLLIAAITAISLIAQSQTCTGTFEFHSQSEVDQFLLDNPTCTQIDGNLWISNFPSSPDPITNLDAFQNIVSISGDLSIGAEYSPGLTSLAGLSSLQSVHSLGITPGAGFTNLNELSGITEVDELFINTVGLTDLDVFNWITTLDNLTLDFLDWTGTNPNPSLYDVFPNLVDVTDQLILGYSFGECDVLTGFDALLHAGDLQMSNTEQVNIGTFDCFHNLTTIDGSLYSSALMVNSISGFENLQSVPYIELGIQCDCDLPDFPSLVETDAVYLFPYGWSAPDFNSLTHVGAIMVGGAVGSIGFTALEEVDGDFDIYREPTDMYPLTEINMNELTSIGGSFRMYSTQIDDLDFLSNLEYVGGALEFVENLNLSNCEGAYICERLATAPENVIMQNAVGCLSNEEVLATCGDSYAEGTVFVDFNCDGVMNGSDITMPAPVMLNASNVPTGSSDAMGHFFVPLVDDATNEINVSTYPGFSSTPQTFVTTNATDIYNNVGFGVCPVVDLHNISTSVYSYAGVRPGHIADYSITVQNHGVSAENVLVTFEFTDMDGMTPTTSIPSGTMGTGSISWNIASVPAFGSVSIFLRLVADVSMEMNDVITCDISADIIPGTSVDIYPSDNHVTLNQTVVNSYDPNDISVNLYAYDATELEDNEGLSLDYIIRFQNTGNAEALDIRVTDAIEELLDLSTIEMIGASHAYEMAFDEEGNVEWLFADIMLPDSTTSEEASHGFVHYRIKTIPGVMPGDIVDNTASIYFDFNEPVITNTATTVFYDCPATGSPLTDLIVCEDETILLNGPEGWDTYSWLEGEAEFAQSASIEFWGYPAGEYVWQFNAATTYCTYNDEVMVTILSSPDAPMVSQNGNTLTASGEGVYSWTFNGETFPGSGNSITITESGTYGVSVLLNSCPSGTTEGNYIASGINEAATAFAFTLSPNPMNTQSTLFVEGIHNGNVELSIHNLLGELVMQQNMTSDRIVLDRRNLETGVYFISLNAEGKMLGRKKLVVE